MFGTQEALLTCDKLLNDGVQPDRSSQVDWPVSCRMLDEWFEFNPVPISLGRAPADGLDHNCEDSFILAVHLRPVIREI